MSRRHFFIVGAQRSGTSYLYEILDEHPQICMAKPKKPEPKYFIGKDVPDINLNEYYDKYFYECTSDKIVFGEKSTTYYEKSESAQLISSVFPGAIIIFLLRNPIERALSNYYFSVNNGLENRSLEDVFLREGSKKPAIPAGVSVDPFNYLGRGDYEKYIKNYLQYFPNTQIEVLLFEELIGSKNEIQLLFECLDVDKTFVNTKIDKLINSSEKNINIPESIKDFLTDYYVEPVSRLSKLINKELSCWS